MRYLLLFLTLLASLHADVASWYQHGKGKRTASGERYDPEGMTCAHRTLPFGTIVKVTNPENGRWVALKVNDNGPFIKGRAFDLSRGAFARIAPLARGVINVEVEILLMEGDYRKVTGKQFDR